MVVDQGDDLLTAVLVWIAGVKSLYDCREGHPWQAAFADIDPKMGNWVTDLHQEKWPGAIFGAQLVPNFLEQFLRTAIWADDERDDRAG